LWKSRIPIVFNTDEIAIKICLDILGEYFGKGPKVIFIKNTLHLEKMYISEAIYRLIKNYDDIEFYPDWNQMKFNQAGNLLLKF
jgi:hypothetical protein